MFHRGVNIIRNVEFICIVYAGVTKHNTVFVDQVLNLWFASNHIEVLKVGCCLNLGSRVVNEVKSTVVHMNCKRWR